MTSTTSDTATSSSTARLHLVRASASVLWAAVLTLVVAGHDSAPSVPVFVIALLIVYPIIDVVASSIEVRAIRHSAKVSFLLVNTAISVVTAVAVGIAAGHGTGPALRVFGIWAVVTGLIQSGTALARRRRERRGQWPMILSGAISAVAGLSFVQMGGQADPKLTVLAGYAVAGALFLFVSVYRVRSSREAADTRIAPVTANR